MISPTLVPGWYATAMKYLVAVVAALLVACGTSGGESHQPMPTGLELAKSAPRFVDRTECAAAVIGGAIYEYVAARPTGREGSTGIEVYRDGAYLRTLDIPGFGFHDAVPYGLDVVLFGTVNSPASGVRVWTASAGLSPPILTASGAGIFNVSVCQRGGEWFMAVETTEGSPFTIRFAKAASLLGPWSWIDGAVFSYDQYAACPELLYEPGVGFVMLYLRTASDGFFTECAVSDDLRAWEIAGPVITPGPGEGVNASDPDLIRVSGGLWVYYASGNQKTWGDVHRSPYPGSVAEMVEDARRR